MSCDFVRSIVSSVRIAARLLLAALLLAALPVLAAAQQAPGPSPTPAPTAVARQVAAPPADILSGRVRLPAPADVALSSRSALLPVRFSLGPDGRGVFEADVPVEAPGDLALVPFSPDVASWSIAVADPAAAAGAQAAGEPVAIETLVARGDARERSGTLDELDAAIHATRWDLHTTAAAGSWRIRIERPEPDESAARPAGWLLVGGGGSARLISHLTTHRLVEGERIGIVAALEDPGADVPGVGGRGVGARGGAARTGRARLLAASLDADTPLGPLSYPMTDDGAHADGAAGDGVFGAWLPDLPPGHVLARVIARGAADDGSAVLRSVQHAFPVLPRTALLTGRAAASPETAGRIALDVGVALFEGPAAPPPRLHVSAEVWASEPGGPSVPVGWLSTMAVPALPTAPTTPAMGHAAGGATTTVRLAFDLRWLALAHAAPPLELRALRLQDPDTHVVHDVLDVVGVDTSALPAGWSRMPTGGATLLAPTSDMLRGAPPLPAARESASPASPLAAPAAPAATLSGAGVDGSSPGSLPSELRRDPALMLVHGYCSSGSVWPAADFSQPKLVFLDPNANRSNDQFALLIQSLGAQKTSFGIVAHSQGGMAGLHLYTFYESGLDHALGPRRIQSVATPYNGTPLAGNLAVIGQIFGGGCGENGDMTPSGAALWLSTIPTWARDEVFYWTTSDGGSACNFLTNLFLNNPEDGVIEMAGGQLPGAHSMGHKTGWCHTTGMSYAASYTDHVRNAEMDAQAAR